MFVAAAELRVSHSSFWKTWSNTALLRESLYMVKDSIVVLGETGSDKKNNWLCLPLQSQCRNHPPLHSRPLCALREKQIESISASRGEKGFNNIDPIGYQEYACNKGAWQRPIVAQHINNRLHFRSGSRPR
jgi:hypothetical protein